MYSVRFAYETGCKCLYPNLPGDYSLVVNHREAGENYATKEGMHAKLVSSEVLKKLRSGDLYRSSLFYGLKWTLHYLPDFSVLSRWQFDFHLRRLGSHSLSAPLRDSVLPYAINIGNYLPQASHSNVISKIYLILNRRMEVMSCWFP